MLALTAGGGLKVVLSSQSKRGKCECAKRSFLPYISSSFTMIFIDIVSVARISVHHSLHIYLPRGMQVWSSRPIAREQRREEIVSRPP